jgi:ATP-binding cassette, subfamily B, multidrug efflux pump
MSGAEYAEEEAQGRDYDSRLMRRFLGFVRPHAALAAGAVALLCVRVAADLTGPFLLRGAIDGPLRAGDIGGLLRYSAFFLAAILLTGLAEYAYTICMNTAGQRIILDLRMRLFSHLQRLPVAFYDRNRVGRLVVRTTNDVENLNEMFTAGLVEVAADVLLLLGAIAMMFWTNAKLALVTMSITPLVLVALWAFRRTARERYREMRRRIARLNGYLNESVHGMRTIQTFGREAACLEKFRTLNAEHRESAIGALVSYAIFYPVIEALSWIAVAVLVGYGGLSILDGSLTFGAFIAFWALTAKFFGPVRELAEKYNILQAAMASAERVFGILDTPPQDGERPGALPAPPLRGEVAFENVSFSYDGKTPVLRDVSFRAAPGMTLAVVGLTGAGKTTIISLLQRYYDAAAGAVKIDGRDVRDYALGGLRRQMGLVLQDVFLFAGTVEDNLRLGETGLSRERIEAAAKAVHADAFIRRLPQGYATRLEERGATLSAGERQLLSFARALAFDPRILILDEATSSVDGATERLIQDALRTLLAGRTSIVIAHRLSTIQRADRILVLHHGRVAEEGTHAELLGRNGLYAKLHRLQFRDPRAEARRTSPEEPPPEIAPGGGLA